MKPKLFNTIEDEPNPVIGNYYLVPCFVRLVGEDIQYTPVINHPHSDIENGQRETHYHLDTRFPPEDDNIINNPYIPQDYIYKNHFRLTVEGEFTIEHLPLMLFYYNSGGTTPISAIKKSKLKHKCIHNGKCPHRGYDLTNEKPINGVIHCPLHGLQFDAETKELING